VRIDFTETHPFHATTTSVVYPVLPITLIGKKHKQIKTYGLLDSGADVSMFHGELGERIGLDVESGRPETINFVGDDGGVESFMHDIRLVIGSVVIACEVAFSYEQSDDMYDQLLGRDVVFDRLQFGLRQSRMELYLRPER